MVQEFCLDERLFEDKIEKIISMYHFKSRVRIVLYKNFWYLHRLVAPFEFIGVELPIIILDPIDLFLVMCTPKIIISIS